ncbi:MAG: hypothetical protein LIO91_02585 [Bacteroidales bacterium]|nr:hypothetical protein [Bacteroidales bacterium]
MSAETKRKISEALKGQSKSEKHKQAISEGLKRYWATIPSENNDFNNDEDGNK